MGGEDLRDFLVLIETYWNVNKNEYKKEALVDFVLIETYWNVNAVYVRFWIHW